MKRLVVHRNLVIFAAICAVFVSSFIPLLSAQADTWSWATGKPTVTSNTEASRSMSWSDRCASKFNGVKDVRKIVGSDDRNRTVYTDCLMAEGPNFKLFESNPAMSISFGGEDEAHQIRNAACWSGCVYMPSRDIFITTDYARGLGGTRVLVYNNFIKSLQRGQSISPGLKTETYFIAKTEPDEVLTDAFSVGEYTATTVYLQRSSNDKWLVFEITGKGLYRMNMDTRETRKFLDWRTDYWYGGPNMEFDITDDGRYIAVFGVNTVNSIYEVTDNCGYVVPQNPSLADMNRSIDHANLCPVVQMTDLLNTSPGLPTTTAYLQQPQFNIDGGEISFYSMPYQGSSDPPRQLNLKAANYTSRQLDYLALGDSYSSGEGDTENDSSGKRYYRQYTNTLGTSTEPRERCHISTRSYPYILAQGMNNLAINTKWNTVACSGAVSDDVRSQGSATYYGQWGRLKGFNVGALKVQALNEFIPGRQKQIEFVKKYQPKVITLTMGGNDVGFGDKISACASPGEYFIPYTCDWVDSKRADLGNQIADRYNNLKSLYTDLYKASGLKSKIYVLGYPHFFNGDTATSCDMNIGSIDKEERALIKNSIEYLNNVIEQAARAAGVKYIDIENGLAEHKLCDSGTKYVTGVTDPLNWSDNLQESFHPNAKGNHEIAMTAWDKVGNASLIDYDICPDTDGNLCPDTLATRESIQIPTYFATNSTAKNTQYKRMTNRAQTKLAPVNVNLDSYTLAPGSMAKVEVHSDPLDLGSYSVSNDGSLNISPVLPASIPAGYHTLIISGKTYSGDEIQYEQIIQIQGANLNDIDDDGIVDNQDKCLFFKPSNVDIDKDGKDDACDPEIGEPPTVIPSPSTSPTVTPTPPPSPQPTPNIIQAIVSIVTVIIKAVINVIKNIWLLFGR